MIPLKPTIYHINKPVGISSNDTLRKFKKICPRPFKKMGHFGTLDPFACGVLLIGVNGAARLNNFIHEELPKTYLSIGKLGVETNTGDHTGDISQLDKNINQTHIPQLKMNDIQETLSEKFLGEYMQAPHIFSASKFEGRPLYEWARKGIEIKKEKKKRYIHSIEVVKYSYPYLIIRSTVSSGTFIRTLFSDIANTLGSVGHLIGLVREKIGEVDFQSGSNILKVNDQISSVPLTDILPYKTWTMSKDQEKRICSGSFVQDNLIKGNKYWALNEVGQIRALVKVESEIQPVINFSS